VVKVFKSINEWISLRKSLKGDNKSIGFVPTMGALHKGHLSLMNRSKNEADKTLVSIFVNPTQFNDPDDLKKYPRTFEVDLKMLESIDVDYLLYPDYDEVYNDNYRYSIHENELSKKLCGAHRPGHFDGVLSVVMKLLNISGADKAYFGEKDYQQYLLIKKMAEAFFIDTEIVPCQLVREKDGLAMSSRNKLLNENERRIAPKFYKRLCSDKSIESIKNELISDGFEIDYIEEINDRRFGAVHLGKVRLIDNVKL
jgi:pantoate--beta-alanine ligase